MRSCLVSGSCLRQLPDSQHRTSDTEGFGWKPACTNHSRTEAAGAASSFQPAHTPLFLKIGHQQLL